MIMSQTIRICDVIKFPIQIRHVQICITYPKFQEAISKNLERKDKVSFN